MRESSGHGEDCSRWEERLQRLAIGNLPRRLRSRMARHLLACSDCRDYLRRAKDLPRVMARAERVVVPTDLAEQIKTACLVATLMEPRPKPARVWVPASFAGATAAAAVLLAVFSYSYGPLRAPLTASGERPSLVAAMQPDRAAEPMVIEPAPQAVARRAAAAPRGLDVAGPRTILAAYHPTDAGRRPVPSVVQPVPAVVAVAPRPARVKMVRGVLVSGIGGPDPASIAAAARRHAETTGGSDDDGSDTDVNGEVATQVAAGVVAGAVIEKYLASTIASRGAAMAATDAAYEASFAADDMVSDDDDATSYE